MLDAMIAKGINAPMASSFGFDAVAAALGACRERQAYEGEAAARLEALTEAARMPHENVTTDYPLNISRPSCGNLLELDPSPMWNAILRDLERGVPACTMALQFHKGLSQAVVETTKRLARGHTDRPRFDTVVLSGGCFQNRILFEGIASQLSEASFTVLSHAQVPANDGGLSLGLASELSLVVIEGDQATANDGERIRAPRVRRLCKSIPERAATWMRKWSRAVFAS